MGWLNNLIRKIAGSSEGAFQVSFVQDIKSEGIPGINLKLVPDDCYVELYLESLRLSRARVFATRFNAVVYSFITLHRTGDVPTEMSSISKPDKLLELDPKSLNKVITVSKQLMGAVPYRGGSISLQLGLFSVKNGNLISPVMDYVTKVSSVAGISFAGTVKPFLPLIVEGMDLLAGQVANTVLEVGVDTDSKFSKSGVFAIIDKPKSEINEKEIIYKDNVLYQNGCELDCGYAVFSLRHNLTKPDYGEIPELRVKYKAFQTAIAKGSQLDARDALTAFKFSAIGSPDLTTNDAIKLVEKAGKIYEVAFDGGPKATSYIIKTKKIEELSEIGLYD